MPNRFGQLSCSGGRQSRLLDRGQPIAPTNGVNSKDHIVFYNITTFFGAAVAQLLDIQDCTHVSRTSIQASWAKYPVSSDQQHLY